MKSNVDYFIIDFGASLIHTHNKQSIYGFANFLKNHKKNFEIWIPLGSKIVIPQFTFRRILLPGANPVAFDLKSPDSWIPSLHRIIHDKIKTSENKFLYKLLLKVNVNQFLLLLRIYSKKNLTSPKILFPTLCPFSISIIKKCITAKKDIEFFCRVTNTSERRGPFSELFDVKEFINWLNSQDIKNVKLGFETQNFLDKLNLELQDNIFISKFPTNRQMKSTPRTLDKKITISFLGYPTKDKGHETIYPIIKDVKKVNNNLRWIVQLYENDPFESLIRELNCDVNFLRGKISQIELEESFEQSDIIVLPYNIEAFKYNASATLYQAMDFEIPVITFLGSGFSDDIEKYKSGLTVKNISDMITVISTLDRNSIFSLQQGCHDYNLARNLQNVEFLNLREAK